MACLKYGLDASCSPQRLCLISLKPPMSEQSFPLSLRQPERAVGVLILATLLIRLAFAASLGLGMDESYAVATARVPQLSYFDHPPISWWMSFAGAHLAGGERDFTVRLPFVLLFALTTWLMFALTRRLYGASAGFWAAATLNLAPVLGMTDASWVLPDGPLLAALLGAAMCLAGASFAPPAQARWWWLAAGVCGGLAILSKYHGFLVMAGAGIFVLTTRPQRRWLATPWPWLAALLALVMFAPVLIWNSQHAFASFRFQGGRAGGAHLNIKAFLILLGGQALWLGPWNFLPLVLIFLRGLRRGPQNDAEWLLICLSAGPILVFTVVALWSAQRVFPHWAAPGYLLLFPILGREIAQRLAQGSLFTRRILGLAGGFWALIVVAAIALPWLPFSLLAGTHYPFIEALDWTDLASALAARKLETPGRFIAATRWMDAGKIDYALGGHLPVTVIGPEPHGYGILHPPAAFRGQDALLVAPNLPTAAAQARFGQDFSALTPLAPIYITHNGAAAITLNVYLATHYSGKPGQ